MRTIIMVPLSGGYYTKIRPQIFSPAQRRNQIQIQIHQLDFAIILKKAKSFSFDEWCGLVMYSRILPVSQKQSTSRFSESSHQAGYEDEMRDIDFVVIWIPRADAPRSVTSRESKNA